MSVAAGAQLQVMRQRDPPQAALRLWGRRGPDTSDPPGSGPTAHLRALHKWVGGACHLLPLGPAPKPAWAPETAWELISGPVLPF